MKCAWYQVHRCDRCLMISNDTFHIDDSTGSQPWLVDWSDMQLGRLLLRPVTCGSYVTVLSPWVYVLFMGNLKPAAVHRSDSL
jgi:hypothetical protein